MVGTVVVVSPVVVVSTVVVVGVVVVVGGVVVDTSPGASHEKVTLCHATSSKKNPYVVITVNFNSIADAQSVGGHGDHADDIIPPYTYTDPQGTVNYPECCQLPRP